MTLDKLDEIVSPEVRTNTNYNNSSAHMQDLFANYHTILSRNGLKWIITDNQKVAVQHGLSAISPASLGDRLQSDLAFSYHPLRKYFKVFLKHAVKLAEAFQLVDSGPSPKRHPGKSEGSRSGNNNSNTNNVNKRKTNTREQDKKQVEKKKEDDKADPIRQTLFAFGNRKNLKVFGTTSAIACTVTPTRKIVCSRNSRKLS